MIQAKGYSNTHLYLKACLEKICQVLILLFILYVKTDIALLSSHLERLFSINIILIKLLFKWKNNNCHIFITKNIFAASFAILTSKFLKLSHFTQDIG